MRYALFYGLLLMLVSCVSTTSPRFAFQTQDLLLRDSFEHVGDWSVYNNEAYTVNVIDGRYQFLSSAAGQTIWGTNGIRPTNTVIEVDVTWVSSDVTAFAGVSCRLNANGLGYYVMVSSGGDFSIRYAGQNRDVDLIAWQYRRVIPQTGTFRMRVVCVDNYLALYINETFISSVTDTRLNAGMVALVMGLPPATQGQGSVAFDNLQIWDANLRE